jgi:HK97 family phage major capsid protein
MKKTLKQINGEMVALNDQINREQDATKKAELVAKFEDLKREAQIAKDAEQAAINEQQMRSIQPVKSARAMFRELIKRAIGVKEGIDITREDETPAAEEPAAATLSAGVSSSVLNTGETNNITSSGAIPKVIKNLLGLLQNKLVYNRVGLQISTGVKGEIVWPVLAAGVTVTVEEEAAEVGDSTLNFSKIVAIPRRLAVATDITNEALEDASFDVQSVVVNNFNDTVAQFLNTALLRTTAVSDGLDGPFTQTGIETSNLSATPTYAELIAMKGAVAGKNVPLYAPAFVMNSELYAKLEATPKAQGQGGFIIENGKIDGDPVYVTEYINTKADGTQETGKYRLEMGCWNYLAANQHGEVRFTIDPLTLASSNETKFVLHTKWSLTNLALADAFKIFKLIEPASSNEIGG